MISHPILHLDGDAFFVACEIAKQPSLRGKPVVVGQDKGIATAMSYEAKRLGVSRGLPVFQIRKLFPQVIILSSDFDTYQRFSRRAMNIVRRYLDRVEEYSIDECFAELPKDYATIAKDIKIDLERYLGITFSVGVAQTKVLAKLASKREKPNGFTILEPDMVTDYLAKIPVGAIWGIGSATSAKINKYGISTAGQLAALSYDRVSELFHQSVVEIWHELNGRQVFRVTTPHEEAHSKSIQDTRSFRPPTNDRVFLLAELSGHVESACAQARCEGLVANRFSFFIKNQGGEYRRLEVILPRHTASPPEIMPHIRAMLGRIHDRSTIYRATGITLMGLRSVEMVQDDLFGNTAVLAKTEDVYHITDSINRRFGERTVMLASSVGGQGHGQALLGETMPLQYLGDIT